MKEPLVSICVLTWNHENYIEQCLQSIIDQDYSNLEIVFLDNCSSDKTYELGESLLSKSMLPVQYYRNERPASISANANFLLSKVNGPYLSFISGDDWMARNNLSRKIERMINSVEVALVYSNAYTYYEMEDKYAHDQGNQCYEGFVFDEIIKHNFITAPGCLLDAAKVKEVGSFNEKFLIEDWDLWLRLSSKYQFAYISEPLVYYRRHNSNTSSGANMAYMVDRLLILEQYKDHKHYRTSKERLIKEIIYSSVKNGYYADASKYIFKNFKPNAFYFKQLFKLLLFAVTKSKITEPNR